MLDAKLSRDQNLLEAVGFMGSFSLAAVAAFAICVSASFYDSFPSTHMGAVVVGVLFLHVLRHPRIHFSRETLLYSLFVLYMLVQLAWTADRMMALNTIVPAINFILIMITFGSLAAIHDIRAILTGAMFGVLLSAILYTLVVGFPFVYPTPFSYNAIAAMYLFGLFVALLLDRVRRSYGILLLVSLVFLGLILATTSIKANLGIVLGVMVTAVFYFGYVRRALLRSLVPVLVLAGVLAYVVGTNEGLMNRIESGFGRVSIGVQVLQAREDVPGYGSFNTRSKWVTVGLKGWVQNPVFGHGVESIRAKLGNTTHTTPVDLLFNSGLIGFSLFYSVFLSIFLRLRKANHAVDANIRALFFGTMVCFLFVAMTGTMHTNAFFAAVIAICVAILERGKDGKVAVRNSVSTQ